jgi:L-ascorbate metabolism protein UlaG (beta-lactamase superfamily)
MDELKVIYVGGPTLILDIDGKRFVTDPTLDPAGSSLRLNDKMTELKLDGPALTDLGHIDVVLLTHDQHYDNLDNLGRLAMEKADTILTTVDGAGRLKNQSHGLNPWESFIVQGDSGKDITITATPARHGPAGAEKVTSNVIGFLISITGESTYEIYLTGDTTYYKGIAEVARHSYPKYVFINAGAARPRGPFNVTMGTNDAIDTASEFPEATLIPLHSEGWSFLTEGNSDMLEAFKIFGIDKQLRFLERGITTLLPI